MSNVEMPLILISSGNSKTGSELAKQLLASQKYRVRVGSRNPTKLSALCAQGAEAVLIDTESSTADAAFKGIDSAFIVLPSLVGGIETTLFHNFLNAAKSSDVKHIIYMSAMLDTERLTFIRHDLYEQQLIESGLPFTILRPTFFYENFMSYPVESIKKERALITTGADGVYTVVAVHDIAAAAAAVLAEPSMHTGQIYSLTTEAVTDRAVVDKISKATGKQIKVNSVTPEEHLNILTEMMGATFASAIGELECVKRDSRWSEVDPALERLLGRKGISLDQFLQDNAAAFN